MSIKIKFVSDLNKNNFITWKPNKKIPLPPNKEKRISKSLTKSIKSETKMEPNLFKCELRVRKEEILKLKDKKIERNK